MISDNDIDAEIHTVRKKAEFNELRARDAEARLRIIEAEVSIIQKRKELMELRRIELE